jgi:hypothetical protein
MRNVLGRNRTPVQFAYKAKPKVTKNMHSGTENAKKKPLARVCAMATRAMANRNQSAEMQRDAFLQLRYKRKMLMKSGGMWL